MMAAFVSSNERMYFLFQPEIYLELEPDKLLKAMSLVKSMKMLKIKLTKKHDQVWIQIMMGQSRNNDQYSPSVAN